ncbi:unnamed protein product [Thelazia callipaeda]|uniref:DUF3453 domain-containing protein n=1 Tax=Thelazia callipaeda TaxID=103827 RepID=A0A0N5CNW9_THECL|nr:unnamed protein product [Thelazia callipaeda]
MASKPKRRRKEELNEIETILLGDDLNQIAVMLSDLITIKEVELEAKVKECPRLGVSLVTILWKCSLQDLKQQSQWLQILKNVVRVLIHICDTLPSLCLQLAEPRRNFTNIAVRILENPKISWEVKCFVLRLISSIAKHHRCLEMIIENTHLIDRIAMALDHEDVMVAKVALQIADVLTVNKHGVKVG